MEAVLLTVGMLALMLLALAAVGRFWPHSSRGTGFHVRNRDSPDSAPPPIPEDDDTKWRWKP